jgi:hypothetical protein
VITAHLLTEPQQRRSFSFVSVLHSLVIRISFQGRDGLVSEAHSCGEGHLLEGGNNGASHQGITYSYLLYLCTDLCCLGCGDGCGSMRRNPNRPRVQENIQGKPLFPLRNPKIIYNSPTNKSHITFFKYSKL